MAATRVIELRTEIPGPRSRAILERERQAVAQPLLVHAPIVAAEARGSTLTDVDGNTFVDFVGGVGVLNVGHGHPRVVQAIHDQADRFLHTDFTVVSYELYVEVAERLGALAPISGGTRSAFFNAGTEAAENAVKLARLYTGRQAVIAFEGAFHGRTLLALTMTSRTHPYKTGLGPFAPEVYRAPFPNAYRGLDAQTALAALERMFQTHVSAENVAAIVFEPQQGEGGFVPAPPAFVEGLRRICDEHGIVLVADEVQTGFGRTARMFAMEHFDVEAGSHHRREVDRRWPAAVRSRSGEPRSWMARTRARSAARSSGTPSRWRPRLAVLDIFAEEAARRSCRDHRRRDPGAACCRLAVALAARSAMFAASARCSPSSSFATPRRRSRRRSSRSRSSTKRCSAVSCS